MQRIAKIAGAGPLLSGLRSPARVPLTPPRAESTPSLCTVGSKSAAPNYKHAALSRPVSARD